MIVALAYSLGEQERVSKLLAYICSLNQYNVHTLVLGVEKKVTRRFFAECLPFFGEVVEFDFADNAEHQPESKNLAFQQCALYIEATFPTEKRFLYLESDAVPMGADWLDSIAIEADGSQKPFIGPRVEAVPTHRIPQHMGAVAVYPVDMVKAGAGEAMIASEQPWPAAIASVCTRLMLVSKLIADDWEGKGVPEGCALYHPDRDGKILDSIWKGREVAKPTAAEVSDVPTTEASSGVTLSPEDRAGSNPAPSNPLDVNWAEVATPGIFPAGLGKTHPEPWENRLQSEETIKFLAAELKKYCTKPAYSKYVRTVLRKAKLIPLRTPRPGSRPDIAAKWAKRREAKASAEDPASQRRPE